MPGVFRRTLSHIWLRLNLPMFLLKVGLLTLVYIDSFINLVRPWSSLPMMLKLSEVALCPVQRLCTWLLEMFLVPFPRVLEVSLCILHHNPLQCIGNCKWHTFPVFGVLVLWSDKQLFDCSTPFEKYLDSILVADVLETLPQSLEIRYHYVACIGFYP